jgi:hypothetical protein
MKHTLIIWCNNNADTPTRKALDELSDLFSYLRVWRIEKHVYIDALMPPTESYHRDLFFQVSYLWLIFSLGINHISCLSTTTLGIYKPIFLAQ